jgi:hypothetical protein
MKSKFRRSSFSREALTWSSLALLFTSLPQAFALDQNNNLQSDVWEMLFGAAGLSATGDADGDGFSNATESVAGTNPKDAASFPGLRLELVAAVRQLQWPGLAGKRYAIDRRTDLASGVWSPIASNLSGVGGIATYSLSNDLPRAFFVCKSRTPTRTRMG